MGRERTYSVAVHVCIYICYISYDNIPYIGYIYIYIFSMCAIRTTRVGQIGGGRKEGKGRECDADWMHGILEVYNAGNKSSSKFSDVTAWQTKARQVQRKRTVHSLREPISAENDYNDEKKNNNKNIA